MERRSVITGVLFVLAYVELVACLRGWCASMVDVGGMLTWVAASVGGVGGVLSKVVCLSR